VLHNQSRRDKLGPDIVNKVCKVLDVMKRLGLNLTLFLDAVSWGDSECIANPTIRIARTGLMTSTELPSILRRWWKPRIVRLSHAGVLIAWGIVKLMDAVDSRFHSGLPNYQ
jgi:hypothetical protein